MRTVIVPDPISKAIGRVGLSRETFVMVYTRIHHDIPRDYQRFRKRRVNSRPELYRYWIVVEQDDVFHRFWFAIDDSTSDTHLFIKSVAHSRLS